MLSRSAILIINSNIRRGALARRTGQSINKLIELALERYDVELRQQDKKHPLDTVWELAAEGRQNVPAGTTSAHDDLYDENGLPI